MPGFPLPDLQSVLLNLRDCAYVNLLDLANAYLAVPVEPESRPLTSFITRRGQFCWRRLPAGVKSAPACFARLASLVLGDLLFQSVFVYMDDWNCACKDFESGMVLLRDVFERIRSANLRLRPQKCRLFQRSAKILGVIIENGTIREDPSRAEKIKNWSFPTSVKAV